jgi:hypothetical protein
VILFHGIIFEEFGNKDLRKMSGPQRDELHWKWRKLNFDNRLGYGLDDRGSRVRFPTEAGNFSLHHRVQNGSEVHPASYPMVARGSFPGGKAAGA